MKTLRRTVLIAGVLSMLAAAHASGQDAAAPGATPPPVATPPPEARLLEALRGNRLSLTMRDGRPSGPGWDWLVREARDARFTLIGEEHGVAETAQFSAALFDALRESGYGRVAIELSPPIAHDIEAVGKRDGLQGIVEFLTAVDMFTFYNLREEAQFLADVLASAAEREGALSGSERVLWGLDREIFNDRYLISRLAPRVPESAREAFARLEEASAAAWARYEQDSNPDNMFLLSERPAVVSAVRAAWPDPDPESDAILRTLEESLAIETAERTGGMWPYMQRRIQWNRDNLAALVRADRASAEPPKLLMKFGYIHMIRGANYVNFFDLGTMADEVAALSGDRAFHILVLPGPGSRQAVPGPGGFVSVASDELDELGAGDQRLARVFSNPDATGHEVIDLRALRPLALRGLEPWNPDVVRTIHGYDAVLIWKDAHASASLASGSESSSTE